MELDGHPFYVRFQIIIRKGNEKSRQHNVFQALIINFFDQNLRSFEFM